MRNLIIWSAAALGAAVLACLPSEKAMAQVKQGDVEKIEKAMPTKAPAAPKAKRKILVFSKTAGFRHSSIAVGVKTMTTMGEKTGAFSIVATEDESAFEPEKLKDFDAVLMLNTTGDCLRPAGAGKGGAPNEREEMLKKSLKDFVSSGKGLIGIHSATDTYHKWKDYNMMMGGTFIQHPWMANSKVSIKNVDPSNPVNASFGGKGFDITDEIYVFTPDTAQPTDRRFLLTLDDAKMDFSKVKFNPAAGKRQDNVYPISWVSTFGKGHTFYCSLGHNDAIYWNPVVLGHYLAGIQYALGDLDADATPTKKAEKK